MGSKNGLLVFMFMFIYFVFVIVFVVWIMMGDDISVQLLFGKLLIMLFIDILMVKKLFVIGYDVGIENVCVVFFYVFVEIDSLIVLMLCIQNGLVYIIWDIENFGQVLIIYFLFLFILFVFLIFVLMVILMCYILYKVKIYDENIFFFEQVWLNLIISEKCFRDVSEIISDWFWEMDLLLMIIWLLGCFMIVMGYDESQWLGCKLDVFFFLINGLLNMCVRWCELLGCFEFKNCLYINV